MTIAVTRRNGYTLNVNDAQVQLTDDEAAELHARLADALPAAGHTTTTPARAKLMRYPMP